MRLDDAGAESDFSLSKNAVLSAYPVVRDRELPIRSGPVICDADFTGGFLVGECMLESIHDEFGHDQTEALGLAGGRDTSFAGHFQRDGPAVANHRGCKGFAQP